MLLDHGHKSLVKITTNSLCMMVYFFDKTYYMFLMVLLDSKSCITVVMCQWLDVLASTKHSSLSLEDIGGRDFVSLSRIMFVVVIHVLGQKTLNIDHMGYCNQCLFLKALGSRFHWTLLLIFLCLKVLIKFSQ